MVNKKVRVKSSCQQGGCAGVTNCHWPSARLGRTNLTAEQALLKIPVKKSFVSIKIILVKEKNEKGEVVNYLTILERKLIKKIKLP